MQFVTAAVAHLSGDAKERALSAAGIPQALLERPSARVPATSFSALWLAVARELDDEFFGLDRRPMKVGSFALVCQAALSSPDLDRALRRILRGFSLFLEDVRGELHLEGKEAIVRIFNSIREEPDRRFAEETMMILLHGLMCWLVGRRIPLELVAFTHARPPYSREYPLMYSNNLAFAVEHAEMRFEARALCAPVVQNASTLQQFLRTAPQSVFLKYRNEESWTAQVRRKLRGSVGDAESWPVFETLAREIGMSPTTLRRRLEREGTTYQTIKDQLRSDVAIDLMCNTQLSIDEVGARIGFQDASAFHRAFKRWNGVQPGEYRRRRREEEN
ncbi:AraC family transcriptional regulator [Hyphomicrobium sp.]|uniref:AraC family transcriptional regulator n=1 Tax=Hyphomicrobium sp. TaxID=82 RepID=UPI002FE0458F